MEKVYQFYTSNVESYNIRINNLKNKIHLFGTIRLILVAGLVAAIWFLKNYNWQILTIGILVFLIPFIVLMVYHTSLSRKKSYAEALRDLCLNELNGLNYDFSAFDGVAEKINGEHSFTLDLDIFGERSFFQSINRTVTLQGKNLLAEWFTCPLTNKKEILIRQEAIKELSTLSHLRQHFYVTGKEQPGKESDANTLYTLTKSKLYFAHSIFWRVMMWIVPALWVLLVIGYLLNIIDYQLLTIFFFICIFLAFAKTKLVNQIHNEVNKMEKIFNTYSNLMKSIEGDDFKSDLLSQISHQLITGNVPASKAIKQLSKYIGALDQRVSAAGIIMNIFTLRDIRKVYALEKWKLTYGQDVIGWIDALAQFDALSSLAGFSFNHPEYIYPEICDSYFQMSGKQLGHPLVPREVCVRNDISIEKNPYFMIVTGANMAGKSTYLRTVGINFLLSCIGAPVWADELNVYPAHLVTSLRTSDSLVSNESYFFAELKRLHMIIERLRNGEELFIILDEILKGTNSIDKQKGSLALIKQLISFKTCGIIATHDLILGTLQEEFPNDVKNYRFEADIQKDELSFSYTLREGVAENMNACFLMQKMGITI